MTDHLDVLMRHRLLQQPGGFEGKCAIAEVVPYDELAVLEREESSDGNGLRFGARQRPRVPNVLRRAPGVVRGDRECRAEPSSATPRAYRAAITRFSFQRKFSSRSP